MPKVLTTDKVDSQCGPARSAAISHKGHTGVFLPSAKHGSRCQRQCILGIQHLKGSPFKYLCLLSTWSLARSDHETVDHASLCIQACTAQHSLRLGLPGTKSTRSSIPAFGRYCPTSPPVAPAACAAGCQQAAAASSAAPLSQSRLRSSEICGRACELAAVLPVATDAAPACVVLAPCLCDAAAGQQQACHLNAPASIAPRSHSTDMLTLTGKSVGVMIRLSRNGQLHCGSSDSLGLGIHG